jgi:MFS family permease
MPVVAVSRGVLGLGAGFMFAVPLGLFALYVPNELRPRAFGLNAAMWGVSALIGPALGAALTGSVGWRWVFW